MINMRRKPVRHRAAPREMLQMSAPAAALITALILHLALPNVYPENYKSDTYPVFLQICLVVYTPFFLFAVLGSRLKAKLLHLSWLLAAAVLLIAALDIATLKTGHLRLPFVPSPDKILSTVPENWQILLESLYHSLRLLITGLVVGVFCGLISGVLMGWNKICNYWFTPVLKIIGPIPGAALLPIFVVIFPSNRTASIAIIVLHIWFPLTLMLSSAIRNIDKRHIEVARVLGAGDWYILRRVALPAAMPAIFNGLFMGTCASFGALVFAEMLGVEAGLGWFITWSKAWGEYAKIYCTVIIFVIVCFTILSILFKVRNRILRWRKGTLRW